MNFISTFDELNKLYEEAPKVFSKKADDLCAVMLDDQQMFAGTKEECEKWLKNKKGPLASKFKIVNGADIAVTEACKEELTESAEDEEIEIVDDEVAVEEIPAEEPVVEDEPRQVICECDKCGALVIKDEADIVVDEDTDLVNVEDECQFCEEAGGYKIVGVVAPYEVAEEDTSIESEASTEEASVDEEPVDEEDLIDESIGDIYRKTFDRPASTLAQQMWEDEITSLQLELEHETDEAKKAKMEKRIKQLEAKFAKQRDWEARHQKQEGFLSNIGNINVSLDGGEGNDVDVL